MTLDIVLVREACLELWDQYHEQIEKLGYSLSKDGMMQSPEEIVIMACISPAYSDEDREKIRGIIPEKFIYKGETIKVGVSSSISSLFGY